MDLKTECNRMESKPFYKKQRVAHYRKPDHCFLFVIISLTFPDKESRISYSPSKLLLVQFIF
jgi:hypothetical protein